MPVMDLSEFRAGEAVAQRRLHLVLRQVDDEGKPRLVAQQMQLDGVAAAVGRALDVADLVDPHRLGQNRVGRAEALPDFERARQRGAGLGLGRKAGIGFEHDERDAVVGERQRGREPDRAGADDRDRILGFSGNASLSIVTCRHAAPARPQPPVRKSAQRSRGKLFRIGRACPQRNHRIRNF